MIKVTNNAKQVVRRAATNFKPGINEFPDEKFSAGDIAQIKKHKDLIVETGIDAPAKTPKGAK